MHKAKIIEFAKENGYVGAEYLEKWRGYDVYERIFDEKEDEVAYVGPPIVILVKDDEIRMSTRDEAFERIQEADE